MDIDYWNKYYSLHGKDPEITKSSSFAEFCLANFFKNNLKNIV